MAKRQHARVGRVFKSDAIYDAFKLNTVYKNVTTSSTNQQVNVVAKSINN